MTRPVRVGLLLDSLSVQRWVASIIEDILDGDYADVALIVRNDAPKPVSRGKLARLARFDFEWREINTRLYQRYSRADYRRYRRDPDAFESVDLTARLQDIPTIPVVPKQTKFVDRIKKDDVARIREHELDVLLRFGFRIIKGGILKACPYGVWSYHHDDNREYRGGPPLFWEVAEQNPLSGVVLQVLTPKLDGGGVIYRSLSSTAAHSQYVNRNQTYWKSAKFIPRCLRQLQREGWGTLEARTRELQSPPYEKPIYTAPTNLQMVGFHTRQLALRLRSSERWVRHRWRIAYRQPSGQPWDATARVEMNAYRELVAPPDRFWADPFVIDRDGRTTILFEDFSVPERRGRISYCTIDPDGRASGSRVALECPYHLSYPFVFEWEGRMWMIPETADAGRVELYVAESWPDRWKLERVLLDGVQAYDATLHQADDRWWMFVNIAEYGASSWDELSLFHAPSPLGPWTPHRKNPVISDVTEARPAGRLFRADGQLIRPAQDCSGHYGRGLRFCRIDVLSEDDYRQTVLGGLDAPAGYTGVHTFNRSESVEVIDANRRTWHWPGRRR